MTLDAHCHLTAGFGVSQLLEFMNAGGIQRAVLLASTMGSVPLDQAGKPRPIPAGDSTPDPYPSGRSRDALDGRPVPFNPPAFPGLVRYNSLVRNGLVKRGKSWFAVEQVPDNEPIAAALAAHPDRFLGFATVNPNDPGHLDTIDRSFARGFRGVKIHAWHHKVDIRRSLGKVASRCGEAGFPVLMHLGGTYRTGLAILELAERFPATNFILAHGGVPFNFVLWRACRTTPNLYFDTAGPDITWGQLARLAVSVPPGRIVFASGAPGALRGPDGKFGAGPATEWVRSLPVGGEARRAILGETLLRLVGLEPSTESRSAASGSHGGRYSNCRAR